MQFRLFFLLVRAFSRSLSEIFSQNGNWPTTNNETISPAIILQTWTDPHKTDQVYPASSCCVQVSRHSIKRVYWLRGLVLHILLVMRLTEEEWTVRSLQPLKSLILFHLLFCRLEDEKFASICTHQQTNDNWGKELKKLRCLPTKKKTVLNTCGTGRAEWTQRQFYVFMALLE